MATTGEVKPYLLSDPIPAGQAPSDTASANLKEDERLQEMGYPQEMVRPADLEILVPSAFGNCAGAGTCFAHRWWMKRHCWDFDIRFVCLKLRKNTLIGCGRGPRRFCMY